MRWKWNGENEKDASREKGGRCGGQGGDIGGGTVKTGGTERHT